MFSTKFEVDRHVENCLKKLNNVTERNLRCFAFAKLYFKIGDYEQARRYVSIYLSSKPVSAEGQQLLGKSLEKLGKFNAALEAYRTSLDLDPKQNTLVIKVCELLASDNINFDQPGAVYFCEKAQSIDPHNPAVFTLKERLILSESKDPNDVSRFLLKEIEVRPNDVDVRIRLLRHFLQNNQVKDAYKHASDIEQKTQSTFVNSLIWYETLVEVLTKYQRDNSLSKNLNWEFWMLLVATLEKFVSLSLDENTTNVKNSTEYALNVFNLDQNLRVATENVKECPDKHLMQEFLNHYRGQLCLHLATLVFKEAKKDFMKYKEASQITLPLIYAAYSSQPADLQCLWFDHTTEANRQLVRRWHREGCFRCSQSGHMILSNAKGGNFSFSKLDWREQLLKRIFITRDQQIKIKNGYFATCPELVDLTVRPPDPAEIIKYDEIAQLVHPDSLHYYIWLGLNQKLSQFKNTVFDGLAYSIKNLNNCSAESLSLLDIDAFLYCAILCAQQEIEDLKHHVYYPSDRPDVLPVAVSGQLGTLNQAKWITCAYKMYKNNYNCDFGEVRLVLIRGIETVRCVGNHGLDVKLLVTLAKTFAERAKNLTKKSEIEYCDARAELYWKAALPLLDRLKNNQAISYSPNRLFDYKSKTMSANEIQAYIDDGKLFGAVQLMSKKEHEKALQLFEGLKDPYASFHQAQIYKFKAEEQMSKTKESVTSEMRSQNIILLSRARDCLYLTLDRLRDPSVDRKHPLNAQLGTEIDKIERMLSRIDPDTSLNRNECDGMSDENLSSMGSMGDHFNYGYGNTSYMNGNITPRNEIHQINSTPLRLDTSRREARPSPERLDAQLRQLAASKDAAINHIVEQMKLLVESQHTLVNEVRDLKKSVEDMKTSAEDSQRIADDVQKMKKEIAELKKDTLKIRNNQLSDDDLYVLDEEYGNDYAAINSNVAGLASNLYPGIPRIPAANTLPYGALYPGMYPMLHYPGLGLPQAGALAFGPEAQLTDFRAINSLSQGLTQVGAFSQTLPQGLAQGLPQTVQPPAGLSQTGLPQLSHCGLVAGQPILQSPALQSSFNTISTAGASTVTTQSVYPSITSHFPLATTTPQTFLSTASLGKPPPVNVVITSSDPLPTIKTTTTQPILSVTIPPQHLKGNQKMQPHNYQIQLPTTTTINTPTVMNQPPLPVTTQSLLSNVAPPIYSAIASKSPTKNTSLGFVIEKSLSQSFNSKTDLSSVSASSIEEPDPCPDFKPIIPLPDEVPLNTGEENETVLFKERAKLFRYSDKEWRERGIGVLKLLKNSETGKVRILMRRDQVHKICANHFVTKDMTLTPMAKNDKAYVWAANDFADQAVVLEKLAARFKTANEAQKFYKAVEDAKAGLPDTSQEVKAPASPLKSDSVTSLGGFVFTSTPTFKPKDDVSLNKTVVQSESPKFATSPFASFTFAKLPTTPKSDFIPLKKTGNESLLATPPVSSTDLTFKHDDFPQNDVFESGEVDDSNYEPPVEFTPVVPLPELVEVKTGEENAEVLFEHKAKLLRFDQKTKDWKERGIGQMKILKYDKTIRLIMRREQVHKVCCNHQLLKKVSMTYMPHNSKSMCWYAQDFSEGVLTDEMFAIRFKTEERAKSFHDAVIEAQAMLDENNLLIVKDSAKKNDKKVKSDNEATKVDNSPSRQVGWGDKYKPKSGSWECKVCYIVNDGKTNYCIACDTPKNENVPKRESESSSKFSFGIKKPQEIVTTKSEQVPESNQSSWGDAFKPKVGSWDCSECYTRNDADKVHCIACENPKAGALPKDVNKGINLDTPGYKFSFGIPSAPKTPANTPTATTTFTFATTTIPATTFSFGAAKATKEEAPLNLTGNKNVSSSLNNDKKGDEDKFVFGSPQKHTFEFTPRSPRRQSGGNADEESESSYVDEEEDNIYFKPVIPLPEKVDVKTGEEDEDVLFCHRSKLFRFANGEWKERGVGDVKILKAVNTGKLRVLMRRDQVLKICLNHALSSSVNYVPKDDKTWLFNAHDFSEGEIQPSQFCIRFKNADIAKEFITTVTDALKNSAGEEDSVKSDESDVEIIFETTVTKEEELEATKLGLPPKFMAYRQLDDCTCDECKKDDILLSELFTSAKDAPASHVSTNTSSIFGTPTNSSFGDKSSMFGTPTFTEKSQTLKDLLAKPSMLSTVETKTPVSASTRSNFFSATEAALKNFSFTLKPEKLSADSNPFSSQSNATKPQIGGNIFGTSTSSVTTSIFSNPSVPKNTSIFNTATVPSSGIFSSTTTSGNIFGGSSFGLGTATTSTVSSSSSVFGAPSIFTTSKLNVSSSAISPSPKSSIFVNSTPTTATETPAKSTNEVLSTSVFGSKMFATPTGTPTFKSASNEKSQSDDADETEKIPDEIVLNCDSDLSFANLAKNVTDVPVFAAPAGDDDKNPFTFLGAGTPVFGSAKATKEVSKDDETRDGKAEVHGDEEYDPHYEPIVPLPEVITVSTGEEEEEAVFNERAKLFRFNDDTKEWKERGVGQFKILYHPTRHTYRFLLRREQVHKVVLNQLITADLAIQPMVTSDSAWMWYGHNYSEDSHAIEKLAARFKNTDLAQKFHSSAQKAITDVKDYKSRQFIPSTLETYADNVSGDDEHESADEEEEKDYDNHDDEDYDDEDCRTIMYKEKCTLSEDLSGEWQDVASGDATIYYDSDIFGARISICDADGAEVSNTLIGINTVMKLTDKECTWKAVECANNSFQWKDLRASFNSAEDAENFYVTYQEGMNYAEQSDIVDEIFQERPLIEEIE